MEGAEEEDEEDTLAGVSAYALRTFLRQCRELTYQSVGQVAARVPALWRMTTFLPAFVVGFPWKPSHILLTMSCCWLECVRYIGESSDGHA